MFILHDSESRLKINTLSLEANVCVWWGRLLVVKYNEHITANSEAKTWGNQSSIAWNRTLQAIAFNTRRKVSKTSHWSPSHLLRADQKTVVTTFIFHTSYNVLVLNPSYKCTCELGYVINSSSVHLAFITETPSTV